MAARKTPQAEAPKTKEAPEALPNATVQGLGQASPENTAGVTRVELDNGTVREDY